MQLTTLILFGQWHVGSGKANVFTLRFLKNCCLFGTWSYHPTSNQIRCVADPSTASPRCSSKIQHRLLLRNQPINFFRICWCQIRASVRFYCSWLQILSLNFWELCIKQIPLEFRKKQWSMERVKTDLWKVWTAYARKAYGSGYMTLCLALSSLSHNLSESHAQMGHSCCQGQKCKGGMQQPTRGSAEIDYKISAL